MLRGRMPSVTRCSKADNHPQGLKSGVPACTSCLTSLATYEPALDTTIIHARDHEQRIL